MSTNPRDCILLVEAAPGFKREAYALIRRAIKQAGLVLVSFVSEREARSYGLNEARFTVVCTDEQRATLARIGRELAAADGWERFPVDLYHD